MDIHFKVTELNRTAGLVEKIGGVVASAAEFAGCDLQADIPVVKRATVFSVLKIARVVLSFMAWTRSFRDRQPTHGTAKTGQKVPALSQFVQCAI